MRFISLLIIIICFLVWPLSIARTAIQDQPIFDYTGDGQLIFYNTHTDELIDVIYKNPKGQYLIDGLEDLDYALRCRLTDESIAIDNKLIELIDHIQDHFDSPVIEVISGYRSPELNAQLRRKSRRVAQRSLHIQGKAIDIRLPGVPTRELRDFAMSLRAGGVGYYPRPDFVHIDVGPVRVW